MNAIINKLPEEWRPKSGEFAKVARYYPAMDFALYLTEDCAYRADRIDTFLTTLWHPTEPRLVGLKLKGFRFLFRQIRAALLTQGVDLSEKEFFPIVTALEIALVAGMGEAMLAAERERIQKGYDAAKKFATDEHAGIKAKDLQFLVAA